MSARFACLSDWLAWQETAHPRKIDLTLDRVRAVLARLAPALSGVPVVTVAGTNGKGSTVAFVEAIYRAAGYRTGAYTSPHLLRYNERLRVAGRAVDDAAICAAFERIDVARGDTSLTYFEWGTLAALDVFAAAGCEVLILEVGLGGRLDAVNAVDADVAIITSVDLDHQQFLGNTREAIGAEKAAIARPGRPLVVADPAPPASVIDHAVACGARLWRFGVDYAVEAEAADTGHWVWRAGDVAQRLPAPRLIGAVQRRNAASAVLAAQLLEARVPVSGEALAQGVRAARVSGRFECRGAAPQWVLDVAHNPEAARNLAANLHGQPLPGRTVAVLGMLDDKETSGVLAPLVGLVDGWHVADLDGPRGGAAARLAQALADIGVSQVVTHADVAAACIAAQREARDGGVGRVLVFGSFHTVEQALRGDVLPPAEEGWGL
ncbi:bifunctional tetrahydrofolate synthase/dihydrofolate synthase [Immundisolibacter sp.]|uniref:bifunctional tetrahydrofolate synthase/dihydrofolate synthase n=1 Tax=Immundisolibacter sp. TaxID=1934948 RepID=UPI003F833C4B